MTHPFSALLQVFSCFFSGLRQGALAAVQALGFAAFFIASGPGSAGAQTPLALGNPGQARPGAVVQTAQVRVELMAYAAQGAGPGQPVWLGLQLAHQPHWHTYWKNPGDSGLPTRLDWKLPAGVHAGDIAWPAPQKINIGTLSNYGYEDTVLLPVALRFDPSFQPPPGGHLSITLHASWLVCSKECIPQEGDFALQLPLTGSTALQRSAFEGAFAAAPRALSGSAASASFAGQNLVLHVPQLPPALRGQALDVFTETPEVMETARSPTAADAVVRGQAGAPGQQGWSEDGSWSARIPLSALRTETPAQIGLVLVAGPQRWHTLASVQGDWPPLPARAGAAPAGPAAVAGSGVPSPLAAGGNWAWGAALATALLGGLILNLMPCVFPVLALKVLSFASGAGGAVGQRSSHRAQGLAYTAGVVASFMALGALLLGLRSAGTQLGWGFQLQSPAVIAALALLFTLIGLNLAGLLQVGHFLPSGLASLQLRHPVGDAFLSGVLAVAVASPCTAPFMGASLGYALTVPGPQAMAIFAALGLGLALPYLAASWVPALGRWLPRPGPWMDSLRRFLAFPMAATVVWLVWVLGHLSGVDGAASLLALLLCLWLLAWSLALPGRSRTVFATISIATGILLTLVIGPNVLKMETMPGPAAAPLERWQDWAPQRVPAALAEGKPVFVDFTAAWCITCQYNKKTVLSDSAVLADFAARQVVLLRADWTRRDPAITAALEQLGRSGVPVYVLHRPGRAPQVLSEILSVRELRDALAAP